LHETAQPAERERAILVGMVRPGQGRWMTEDYLNELELLADTAGAQVLDRMIQERGRIEPAYFISRGKVELLAGLSKALKADAVIFDDDLTPAQVRNLEKACETKILDRSGVILDIFAKRAKTREAQVQVELAQLKYLLPRLTRRWTHLSRQYGGIGTRGPGETQLEVDRRVIRKRIATLTKELEKIQQHREIRRRHRTDLFIVALVGYTNVGKSTILNILTQSGVFVEDRLFATLDATVRLLKGNQTPKIVLIDTVGFIRKLPAHLVASFKSTLEEMADADLLLHVVDISHPQFREQMTTVKEVLGELGMANKPTLLVFNKIDKLEERGLLQRVKQEFSSSVFISATRGIFLEDLRRAILDAARQNVVEMEVAIDLGQPKALAQIYNYSEVLERRYTESQAILRVRSDKNNAEKIRRLLEALPTEEQKAPYAEIKA